MFVDAIEEVGKFTRPVHTITRNYNDTFVQPGAATFFFINELGVAITAKHVMSLIGNRVNINATYETFKKEKEKLVNRHSREVLALEEKYKYTLDTIVQIQELFLDVTNDPQLSYRWIAHPKHDLAILIFENFKNPRYQSYARFVKDSTVLKQGLYLCRLGYPFPEFNNFTYDIENDQIAWTNTGQVNSPRFPIEGMLTRHVMVDGVMAGLELSTPGLRGQSGGPVFTKEGLIAGMQSSTQHLHLGFDMKNYQYQIGGKSIQVNNQPFLHVGRCVHADVIKGFLKENNIKFYEE